MRYLLGELLGLKWKDINMPRKRIVVKRQLNRKGILVNVKTKAGERVIPLTNRAINTLKHHKIRQNEYKLELGEVYKDLNFVGALKDGRPIHCSCLNDKYKELIKKGELPKITFHDMRQTFSTLFLENGGDITVLQQILGHSSITVTIDTYGHVTENMLKEASYTMESMFKTKEKRKENKKINR